MWIVIEIQILGKTSTLGKNPHGGAPLQDEARACGAAIQECQQPLLKCIASLREGRHRARIHQERNHHYMMLITLIEASCAAPSNKLALYKFLFLLIFIGPYLPTRRII
jgi:hypothetical protein